jgi:hypothetical protein
VDGLVFFHHDPTRTDAELDAIQTRARARLDDTGVACAAAYEGLQLEMDAGAPNSTNWDTLLAGAPSASA